MVFIFHPFAPTATAFPFTVVIEKVLWKEKIINSTFLE